MAACSTPESSSEAAEAAGRRPRPAYLGPPAGAGVQAHRLGLLVLCALLLVWRPGVLLDDEIAQAASLTSMADGHLALRDLPAGYDPVRNTTVGHWNLPAAGGPAQGPVASTMLSALALPVLLALRALAAAVGVQLAIALACATAWAVLAWRERRGLLWLVPPAFLATPLLWPQAPPASPALEVASLQLVSLAAHAATAALLWRLLEGRATPGVRLGLVLTYAFATPMAFWALSAKYHALAGLLLVLALWLYRDGARASVPRTFAAFLVAGLACWNELVLGGFLAVGLGVVALRGLRQPPSHWLPRAAAAAAGFALGFAAFLLQQARLRGEGVAPQFPVFLTHAHAAHATGAVGAAPLGLHSADALVQQGYLSHTLLADPLGGLSAIAQSLVWTRLGDVDPSFSFLSVAPFAALALAALLHRAWRRAIPGDLRLFAAAYAAVLLFFMGDFLLEPGGGYDIRYAATFWPLLALLAAPAAQALFGDAALRAAAKAAAGGAASLLPLAVVPTWALHQAVLGYWSDYNYASEHLVLFRYGGLAVAFAILASLAWARAWSRPLVVAGIALAVGLQVLLQLSTGRVHEPSVTLPGVFAPFEALHRAVWKALFTFGGFTIQPD